MLSTRLFQNGLLLSPSTESTLGALPGLPLLQRRTVTSSPCLASLNACLAHRSRYLVASRCLVALLGGTGRPQSMTPLLATYQPRYF